MQFRSGRYASLLRAIARCFASRQIILRGSFIGSYLNKEEQHAPQRATLLRFIIPRERKRERESRVPRQRSATLDGNINARVRAGEEKFIAHSARRFPESETGSEQVNRRNAVCLETTMADRRF